jgi:hypothetical protein
MLSQPTGNDYLILVIIITMINLLDYRAMQQKQVVLGSHLLIGAHTEKSMVLEEGEDNNCEQDLDHQ